MTSSTAIERRSLEELQAAITGDVLVPGDHEYDTARQAWNLLPATRTARAEAGAQWQDVTVPAGEHGLAALAGTSPNVGVTGYTLGGGLGWLARRYGLAANSVTAVEIVTPAAASRAPTPTTSRTCSGPSEAAAAASGS